MDDNTSRVTVDVNKDYDNSNKNKKLLIGVKWPDQGNQKEPISETILRSEMDNARRPRDVKKITSHRRVPSNKLKSIIK